MSMSTRILAGSGAVVMTAGALLFASGGMQSGSAATVIADLRKALGGEERLAAVKTLTAQGKRQQAAGETSTVGDYTLMLEMPDKFLTTQVSETPFGTMDVTQGFNGAGLIQSADSPSMAGGRLMVRPAGSSLNASPEQKTADRARVVASQKSEFARMALGMFGTTGTAMPVEFSHGGTAAGPDGVVDVIDVKGAGDFAGKLFVDQKSHLPLMFSWMAKEPLRVAPPTGSRAVGGTSFVPGNQSKEERDRMLAEMDEARKQAEAQRKVVEYRVFYTDYKAVDGLRLPHHFVESLAGKAQVEVTIDKYKINPKIDAKKFETVK